MKNKTILRDFLISFCPWELIAITVACFPEVISLIMFGLFSVEDFFVNVLKYSVVAIVITVIAMAMESNRRAQYPEYSRLADEHGMSWDEYEKKYLGIKDDVDENDDHD